MAIRSAVELETLIRARYPLVYVVSWEEKRVEDALRAIARERGKKLHIWTVTQGFPGPAGQRDPATRDPLAALDYIMTSADQAVFLLKDFHSFIGDFNVTRRLRDLTPAIKNSYKNLIILAPVLKLPPELEKEVTVLDFPLPSFDDLGRLLDDIIRSVPGKPDVDVDLTAEEREHVLKAAQGLTAMEAENVFAKSLVEKRTFDVNVVLSEKEQIIRKSGILEYYPADSRFSDVGGLDVMKDWMLKRAVAFSDKARAFGLPEPKGILLLGVQGCGKSLSAKAIGAQWRLPLLRLDVGKIFAGIVGSSEENMRKAIRVSESVAPCVLWLDELEKGFAGISGTGDSGTTSRVFSTFLTWLQEKTVPVFVVATANQIESLPPELLRKGRFDEIFFIDLPSREERSEIFRIHITKSRRDPEKFDIAALAEATPGFSGAEIEQIVYDALHEAFHAEVELGIDHLLKAVRVSVPLSMTMREKIAYMREWAETRARKASSAPVETLEAQMAAFLQARAETAKAEELERARIEAEARKTSTDAARPRSRARRTAQSRPDGKT